MNGAREMKPNHRSSDYSDPAPRGQKTPKRRHNRVEPHSPWQLLVSERREALQLSARVLADKIKTPNKAFSYGTVWAWIYSAEGTPPPKSYTPEINRKLAIALEISPDVLAKAYEDSRRKFVVADNSTQMGPLNVLRLLFSTTGQKTFKPAEIVKLIDQVQGK